MKLFSKNSKQLKIINSDASVSEKIEALKIIAKSGNKKMIKELVKIMLGNYEYDVTECAAESLRELSQTNMEYAKEAIRIQSEIANGKSLHDL